jgi:hypothetical protein
MDFEKTHVQPVSVTAGWSLFRVTTANSNYTVGLRQPSSTARRVGALVGIASGINVRDTDPRVGERSVFELPTEEWIGKRLDFADVKTSPVVRVMEETDVEVITHITTVGLEPLLKQRREELARDEQKASALAWPMTVLQYAELAQGLLKRVEHDRQAVEAIRNDPRAKTRLQIAVAGCVALADAIADELK